VEFRPKRDELIELIEQVDQVHVDSTTIVMELLTWLPEHVLCEFTQDVKRVCEIEHVENDRQISLDLVQCSEV
jgi:hypothetical protein